MIKFPKGKVIRALGIVFILVILAVVFCAGKYLGQVTPEPQVVITYEIHTVDKIAGEAAQGTVDSVVERVVYRPVGKVIERVVYEPVERTVLNHIENPKPLLHFQAIEELQRWLENIELVDISSEVVDKEINQGIKSFDCDDYALKLQEKALRDGYMMSFEVIYSGEYSDLFKQGQIPDGTIHAINSVIIGNEVYYNQKPTKSSLLPVLIRADCIILHKSLMIRGWRGGKR